MGTTGTETHFLTEKEVEQLAMVQQRQEEVWCVCVCVCNRDNHLYIRNHGNHLYICNHGNHLYNRNPWQLL